MVPRHTDNHLTTPLTSTTHHGGNLYIRPTTTVFDFGEIYRTKQVIWMGGMMTECIMKE